MYISYAPELYPEIHLRYFFFTFLHFFLKYESVVGI